MEHVNRSELLPHSSSFQPQSQPHHRLDRDVITPTASPTYDASLRPQSRSQVGKVATASNTHGELPLIQDNDLDLAHGNRLDVGTANDRRSFQYSLSEKVSSQSTGNPKISMSSIPRSGRGMAAILDLESSRTRRERTFIGAECAVCDEPLEHTLRGERVLQLSCGHVSHEACFYEYIKEFDANQCPTCDAPLGLDTSRGGNVLDLEKLSKIIRSSADARDHERNGQITPTAWDQNAARNQSESTGSYRGPPPRDIAEDGRSDGVHSRGRAEHPLVSAHHGRTGSREMGVIAGDDLDSDANTGRKHDYDVHAMEANLSSPHVAAVRNPIPPPTVTVRSEFPTLNRSRQQQSLTCLITVEVQEGKWRPDSDPFRNAPPLPGIPVEAQNVHRAPSVQAENLEYDRPEENMDAITEDLQARVENWHGLDFPRFGKLRLHGTVRVGKDRQSWQELECYLFSEMLICVKDKRSAVQDMGSDLEKSKRGRATLKGSILIKKHLKQIEFKADEPILTLNLSVAELPLFHLQFRDQAQLEIWKRALLDVNNFSPRNEPAEYDHDASGTDEEDYRGRSKRESSTQSSYGAARSSNTAPTEYTNSRIGLPRVRSVSSPHVPVDIVVVIPVSSSMQGLKISLLRETLKFLVQSLGERDRMGLVTFGSSGGGVPLVGMTTKTWNGWSQIIDSIRPVGQKSLRADVVEGANVAMDLLMQRRDANPLSNILLISDSSTSDGEGVDFVVSRAEAAKVSIYSFGLGLTHKPDNMIELSTRTKASYTYVKDWMMLRECVAGCLGSMQTTSHQNVKLRLRLPEGSPAKFVKISGALQITKRATGRDAEAGLGDLRFGDKRDILVQLAIVPDTISSEQFPQDVWESIVSGLEALGGPVDQEDQRPMSVEEVPLIQADLTYNDILRDGTHVQLPRPSLLTITVLPPAPKPKSNGRPSTPPIPPHPSVVQRRMELLTSDMLTRALTLVSRSQHERAHHLLTETRSILKGLGKGGLPPLPAPSSARSSAAVSATVAGSPNASTPDLSSERRVSPTPRADSPPFSPASGIDAAIMAALDAELEASLEWILHPAVFGRDSRKQVLQAIGVISSQRAYTFRTLAESLWASRIAGIKKLVDQSREWRESGDDALLEEM